ncbi:MAG: zinc ribbon domain-containing protein [Desulfovibrio sp.]|nr:MAG: zinc ribbon domain-containing protein [Desulfovibrio sp.]
MPIYEYCCPECNQVFEEWQSNFEEHEVDCPMCKTPSKRIMSNTSFILKGSGWYVTDYAAKNPSAGNNGGTNGAAKDGTAKSNGDSASSGKSKETSSGSSGSSETKKAAPAKQDSSSTAGS